MDSCLFCRIVRGEIPSSKVYEDDRILAFRDINPQAPTHILIIPKRHIPSILDAGPSDADVMGRLFVVASQIARDEGLADGGFRTVVNCGEAAGQSVPHLHMHLLGGRKLAWPPG